MLTKGIKKYLANPIIGILPFVAYIILQAYVLPEQYALATSIAITLLGEYVVRDNLNNRIHGLTFYITAIALVVTALLWIVGNSFIEKHCTYILVGEIAIVIQLMIFRLGKTFLKTRLFKKRTFMDKALLNDFFFTAAMLQYILTTHIFIILAYKQITEGYLNPIVDHFIYIIAPIIIIVGLFIYQVYRTQFIVNKLRQEEWLPIVTEKGEVTGRIAKAVSRNLKNKFMHPVVRIALICNKKVYLQERDNNYILDSGKIDHPFEKYMLFRHEVNTAAHNSIKRMLGCDLEKDPHFVFKYIFENETTKRLIFFFTVEISNESLIPRSEKMTGKFWTVKQIDQEFNDGIFSECFELEYEYLKHMILLEDADNLIAKEVTDSDNSNELQS